MTLTRTEVLKRLRKNISDGVPIIGGGAGTGISAKFEEAGGVDLIIIYNSGRFRMAGRGSLAGPDALRRRQRHRHGDGERSAAHRQRHAGAGRRVRHRPLPPHGVGSSRQVKEIGFAGVQNFPTVGLIDGSFRQNLEETGMGYGLEIEMMRMARELDLVTTPYVFNVEEAKQMAAGRGRHHRGAHGADDQRLHRRLHGADAGRLGGARAALADAANSVNPEVIMLCHGGPIAMPEDAEYVLQRTQGVHGFYGASSMERLPTEQAITGQMKKFKAVRFS